MRRDGAWPEECDGHKKLKQSLKDGYRAVVCTSDPLDSIGTWFVANYCRREGARLNGNDLMEAFKRDAGKRVDPKAVGELIASKVSQLQLLDGDGGDAYGGGAYGGGAYGASPKVSKPLAFLHVLDDALQELKQRGIEAAEALLPGEERLDIPTSSASLPGPSGVCMRNALKGFERLKQV
eukprot:6542864-Prymnesium_polylepis.1